MDYRKRQSETGTRVEEICRQLGVSQATFFNWNRAAGRKKYDGMGVAELRKLRHLEVENAQLEKLVADLILDKQVLQDVIKAERTPYNKEMASWLISNYRVSIQRACRWVKLVRAMYDYKSHRRDDTLLTMRIKEIANARVQYGF